MKRNFSVDMKVISLFVLNFNFKIHIYFNFKININSKSLYLCYDKLHTTTAGGEVKNNRQAKPDQNGIQKCHLATTVRKHFVASGLEVHASTASDVDFGNKVLGTIHPLRHESP